MRDETLPLSYFEDLYDRSADPWHFGTSSYEAAKYAATLAALPHSRYHRGLEVGCSIGVFTATLADRCDALVALEPVASALTAAAARNADKPWVRFAEAFVPRDWPSDCFDLVLMSEVLDYLGAADLVAVDACLRATLEPGGDLVLVHWVGKKAGVGRAAWRSERDSDRGGRRLPPANLPGPECGLSPRCVTPDRLIRRSHHDPVQVVGIRPFDLDGDDLANPHRAA